MTQAWEGFCSLLTVWGVVGWLFCLIFLLGIYKYILFGVLASPGPSGVKIQSFYVWEGIFNRFIENWWLYQGLKKEICIYPLFLSIKKVSFPCLFTMLPASTITCSYIFFVRKKFLEQLDFKFILQEFCCLLSSSNFPKQALSFFGGLSMAK